MRNTPATSQRVLGLGVAIAVLAALACLSFAALSDSTFHAHMDRGASRALTLSELSSGSSPESVLMSCADAAPVSESLLWCSDPSSPQCIPAAPAAPRIELWDSPHVAALTVPELSHSTGYAARLSTWQSIGQSLVFGRTDIDRLERPPRSA